MKRNNIFCGLLACATVGFAADIRVEDIPADEIKRALPKDWRIESISPAETVSGWEKLSGSKGIDITISRTPYDDKLHRTKSGELALHVPRYHLFVFPDDFVARHVNGAGVFKDGKVATAKSPLANRSMLVMEKFTRVGDSFVFHNNPSFHDWKTPVTDIIEKMKEVPN